MSTWTPYQINIILHYHCRIGIWPLWQAPIFPETVNGLVKAGILRHLPGTEAYVFETTERGKALIEMWCSTPLPEMRFVDPRFAPETP